MTEYERMIKGLIYDPADPEIVREQFSFLDKLWEFNRLKPSDFEAKTAYMKTVFAECGDNNYIELPFRANWGGHHTHWGSNIYANSNLTLVDDGHIYIGDRVMIGPNVTIATANHPVNPELRKRALQYNKDVHIDENVWIGANVVIVPGIHIGKNSVIGAGSVVTKDIPENVLAVGNPSRVLREISKRDCGDIVLTGRSAHCFVDKEGKPVILKKTYPELNEKLKSVSVAQ
ncbi:MAG: sugar O-acetyltransferase [Clostridia bacterium]|nr:sugar O-acetyltransferase [Clostridia bacterium]